MERITSMIAELRLQGSQWQVKWPEDNEFHNLVGWFETKTYEQTVEKLKSFPLNINLKYKLIGRTENENIKSETKKLT